MAQAEHFLEGIIGSSGIYCKCGKTFDSLFEGHKHLRDVGDLTQDLQDSIDLAEMQKKRKQFEDAVLVQPPKTRPHPLYVRFHQVMEELGLLHDTKQEDYGRENDPFANVRAAEEWDVPAWVGAMIRATDKVRRLQAFRRNGRLSNEGVEDSLKDLAVYSVIALVLYEEATGLVATLPSPSGVPHS